MSSSTQKILRCLMLTQSNNDHEALAAIRKANQLLAVHSLNWEQYFGVALRYDEEPDEPEAATAPKKTRYEKTMEMIQFVKRHLEERESPALEFIQSLEKGLATYGSLTPNQMNALKKFHKNASRARAPF